MRYASQIRKNATEIVRLHSRIHETLVSRSSGEDAYHQWKAACAEFHEKYDSLAFKGGVRDALERLRHGDSEAIDYAIDFLVIRPYFFRSGYMYKDFMRVLRNCPLTDQQRERYERIHRQYQLFKEMRRKGFD